MGTCCLKYSLGNFLLLLFLTFFGEYSYREEESQLVNCMTDGAIAEADIEEMDMIIKQVEKQCEQHPAVCEKQGLGRNFLHHNTVQERWGNQQEQTEEVKK